MKTEPDRVSLAVLPLSEGDEPVATELVASLGLPLLATGADSRLCATAAAVLAIDGSTLSLQLTGKGAPGPVAVDFGARAMRHRRRSGHNELLGRAVGIGKKPELQIIDATAGLGRDSFVLADLGCLVLLCERNPVIARLLQQGLYNARNSGDVWLADAAMRMRLYQADARTLDTALESMDVIYLDPMFPRRDKSAAVKKDMALFQFLLEEEPGDGSDLLDWALVQDVARVVVKRPPRAPALGDIVPSHSIQGKAVRYDVHVKRALS